MKTLKNDVNEAYCKISSLLDGNTIVIKWISRATLPQIEKVAEVVLTLLKDNPAITLLSDFSECKGFDQATTEFFNTQFYPELARNGISKHAFIFSEEAYKRLMCDTFCKYYSTMFETAVFNSTQKGNNWLQNSMVRTAS
jgi:hypothetical protein